MNLNPEPVGTCPQVASRDQLSSSRERHLRKLTVPLESPGYVGENALTVPPLLSCGWGRLALT